MKNKILAGILFDHWTSNQDMAFLIAIIAMILLLIIFIILLAKSSKNVRSERNRVSKRIAWYKEQIKLEEEAHKQAKLQPKINPEASISKKEQPQTIDKVELDALLARQTLSLKEEELKRLFEINEMTKTELAEYQEREGTYVSEDVIINIITEHEIKDCNFMMDSNYSNCKIPRPITYDLKKLDIIRYASKKDGIEIIEGKGKNPTRFKVNGKVFALITFEENGKIKMSYKCGPSYGSKLISILDKIISKAKFPYGLLWFSVSNQEALCSLELIKLLMDISYRITRLGY